MKKEEPFQLRGIQLDLARQMETLDFIFEFIDFIERSGYNTLVLYLEGRIKTKSFPYPKKGEYYTPKEMRKVVAYATKKKIDVIPVVSVFGHAEHFLKHKELEYLSEIRGDARSPLGEHINHVFCLSLPETIRFIKAYLTEVTEIFSSNYLHLGCDEAWDVGCCHLCRDRIHKGETLAELFAKHLIKIHNFVKNELHKQIIIWDDLFECYEEALELIPRDIILCCWNYGQCVDVPKAHFKSRLEEDVFAKYDKMGFKYLFAPAPYYANNIKSFTEYASKYRPLGGILTTWEKSLSFMYEIMPLIHYAGRVWSGNNISLEQTNAELFGKNDKLLLGALTSYYDIKLAHPTRLDLNSYLAGPLTEFESMIKSSSELNKAILKTYIKKCSDDNSRNIIEDILVSLEWRTIMFELRMLVEKLFVFNHKGLNISERKKISNKAAKMVDKFLTIKLDQWAQFRDGLVPEKLTKRFSKLSNDILLLAEKSSEAVGILKVKFFLPDMHNAQKSSFAIMFEDGSSESIANGVFKNYEMNDAFFILKFPYYTNKSPVSIQVESWLYGGIGLAYMEIISDKTRFVPLALKDVRGIVKSPHHLMFNDLRYCNLGESDMAKLFEMPELAQQKHGLTLLLKNINEQ